MIRIAQEVGSVSLMSAKGLGGNISQELQHRFRQTVSNPIVLESAGLMIGMKGIPWLHSLQPSSKVLQALWERNISAIGNASLPDGWEKRFPPANLTALLGISDLGKIPGWKEARLERFMTLCNESVAKKNDQTAVECMHTLQTSLIPALQTKLGTVRRLLYAQLPTGSYFAETDYWEGPDWASAYWGMENYKQLLRVKQRYDPHRLFRCHHCVGSKVDEKHLHPLLVRKDT